MKRSNKFANLFYALLLAVGIAFAVTATAYGVMAFREARPAAVITETQAGATAIDHPLMTWLSQHGEVALITELSFLAVFVFGAIATDDYWQRRKNRRV